MNDDRGHPLILDEFHCSESGELYINQMCRFPGYGRTKGDLRGKNRFTYDESRLGLA